MNTRRELSGFEIRRQPDDVTCGPTCLHAIYRYFGDPVELAPLLEEIPMLRGGGTLDVLLATHALERGYRARIYTWNLQIFDPTWFALPRDEQRARLLARADDGRNAKQKLAQSAPGAP